MVMVALGPPSRRMALGMPSARKTRHSSSTWVWPSEVEEMKTLLPLPSVPKADQRVVRASWAHWPSRTMEVEELSTTGVSGQLL